MARPDYSALGGSITADDTTRTGNGGNPNLKPIRSTNFDATLEWYFAPARAARRPACSTWTSTNYVAFGTYQTQLLNIRDRRVPRPTRSPRRSTASGTVKGFELRGSSRSGRLRRARRTTRTPTRRRSKARADRRCIDLVGTSKNTYNVGGYYENTASARASPTRTARRSSSAWTAARRSTRTTPARSSASLSYTINDNFSLHVRRAEPERSDAQVLRRQQGPAARVLRERAPVLLRRAHEVVGACEAVRAVLTRGEAPLRGRGSVHCSALFSCHEIVRLARRSRSSPSLLLRRSRRRAAEPAVVPDPASIDARAGRSSRSRARRAIVVPGRRRRERADRGIADLVARAHGVEARACVSGEPRDGAINLVRVRGAAAPRATGSRSRRDARDRSPPRPSAGFSTAARHAAGSSLAAASARSRVPAVAIEDAPRFAWRGLMLDSARHYQSPEFIKPLHRLDGAAQAQRAALAPHRRPGLAARDPQVPAAHRRSARWRVPAGARRSADLDPATGKPRLYGGYYSQDDGARARRATPPSAASPSFPRSRCRATPRAAIAAYPQLAATASRRRAVPADWGVYPQRLQPRRRDVRASSRTCCAR